MPIKFDGDTNAITNLIENAPQLTYSGGSPVKHRKEANNLKDELDYNDDGLAETEEQSKELSIIAQFTMLVKTIEILGQVLKNQYSTIERTRKGTLLDGMFNGSLRALHNFYNFFEKNPESLAKAIEATIKAKGKISDEEKRKRLAKKIVADLIQIITFGLMLKASLGANSNSLLEDVQDVVKKNNSMAFKLIELGIYLDSPKTIPRDKLITLYNAAKSDPIVKRIIHFMIVNRLYMFHTTEQDLQWLRDSLRFLDIKKEHIISYNDNKQRLIK